MLNKYLEKIADLSEEELRTMKSGAITGALIGLLYEAIQPDRTRSYLKGALVGAAEGSIGNLGLMHLRKEL